MIPECVSFQNEVRTSLRRSRPGGFRGRPNKHAPLAPNCTRICDFQTGTRFVFSLQDTRMKPETHKGFLMKLNTRTRISFRVKTGMT